MGLLAGSCSFAGTPQACIERVEAENLFALSLIYIIEVYPQEASEQHRRPSLGVGGLSQIASRIR